jgi:hypothetical protein
MQEAHGLHKAYFETLTGTPLENRVRMLCCPKKRWFYRLKHAPRMVSSDLGRLNRALTVDRFLDSGSRHLLSFAL